MHSLHDGQGQATSERIEYLWIKKQIAQASPSLPYDRRPSFTATDALHAEITVFMETYKCEFSSYPHAGQINQQCIPCQPHLIHIPAGLLQGERLVIKQDRYAELVKTQRVQQHGTKAKTSEDRSAREGAEFLGKKNNTSIAF